MYIGEIQSLLSLMKLAKPSNGWIADEAQYRSQEQRVVPSQMDSNVSTCAFRASRRALSSCRQVMSGPWRLWQIKVWMFVRGSKMFLTSSRVRVELSISRRFTRDGFSLNDELSTNGRIFLTSCKVGRLLKLQQTIRLIDGRRSNKAMTRT